MTTTCKSRTNLFHRGLSWLRTSAEANSDLGQTTFAFSRRSLQNSHSENPYTYFTEKPFEIMTRIPLKYLSSTFTKLLGIMMQDIDDKILTRYDTFVCGCNYEDNYLCIFFQDSMTSLLVIAVKANRVCFRSFRNDIPESVCVMHVCICLCVTAGWPTY